MDIASLNDCLIEPPEPETADGSLTIRLKPSTKAKLAEVCERHGTTPGAFLRRCAERITTELGTVGDHAQADA